MGARVEHTGFVTLASGQAKNVTDSTGKAVVPNGSHGLYRVVAGGVDSFSNKRVNVSLPAVLPFVRAARITPVSTLVMCKWLLAQDAAPSVPQVRAAAVTGCDSSCDTRVCCSPCCVPNALCGLGAACCLLHNPVDTTT